MQDGEQRGPWLYSLRSSKGFKYTAVNLAVFIDSYLYSLIIPVVPFALTEVININPDDVQWWIGTLLAAYGAGLLIASPIVGYYADQTGSRKWPFLVGLISLALSTIMFSLATKIWVLILGRLVQGASSAAVHTVGVAVLADTAGDSDVGIVMGFVTTNIALGIVVGPLMGGFLYHHFGYMAVFISAYVIVALDFIFRLAMIEGSPKDRSNIHEQDPQSYGTFAGTTSSVPDNAVVADVDLTYSPPTRTSSPATTVSPVDEEADSSPSKPRPAMLELLLTPRLLAAILGDFLFGLIATILETVLPLYLKSIFQYNSQDIGVIYLFLVIPSAIAPLMGYVTDRIGARITVSVSAGALLPLMVCLRLVDHHETGQVVLLCLLLVAIGLALNMIYTTVFSEARNAVDEKSARQPGVFGDKSAYSTAFALMNMAYAFGSLAGPLLGGWLMGELGWSWVTLSAGLLSGLCMVPMLAFLGGRKKKAASTWKQAIVT